MTYGHAPGTVADCARCPGWAPRHAVAINDADEKVCLDHARETMPELQGA